MSKRTVFTTISPLPPNIPRQLVIEFLHDHEEMIDLNPLVIERHPIKPPAHCPPDEMDCAWYSLTDKISYLPGGLMSGDVTYTCAFHDIPTGVQTHCYAPAGLNIQGKWTLNGSLPGEPVQPVELGIGAPATGLYLREDVNMKCNVIMTSFVKRTLKKSHATLVDRLKSKAQLAASDPAPIIGGGSTANSQPGFGGQAAPAPPSSSANDAQNHWNPTAIGNSPPRQAYGQQSQQYYQPPPPQHGSNQQHMQQYPPHPHPNPTPQPQQLYQNPPPQGGHDELFPQPLRLSHSRNPSRQQEIHEDSPTLPPTNNKAARAPSKSFVAELE
ncbi:hypothetical protein B0H63DRAFT_126601 [Podospora didyma]|uniref:DUF7053 domain-containing protein n=1 Tax=Podospora didyma TaxID=330526 RepID=A0AAE0P0D0_9PEZI|nr:hypothetical protein B0H63DRAFT_126601 [Podospora didyma]